MEMDRQPLLVEGHAHHPKPTYYGGSPCTRGTTLGAKDRLHSLWSMQPFAFLPRLLSRRPYCRGLYKNSQPLTYLTWTTHYSSDDTVF